MGLSVLTRNGEKPPSIHQQVNECIKELEYFHTVEYYQAMKKDELLICETMSVNIKLNLGEISQAKRMWEHTV